MQTSNDSTMTGSGDATLGAGAERVRQNAHQTVDRLADAAQSAAERLSMTSEDLMARQEQIIGAARDYVREKPLTALGIAVAAGFILSRLSR